MYLQRKTANKCIVSFWMNSFRPDVPDLLNILSYTPLLVAGTNPAMEIAASTRISSVWRRKPHVSWMAFQTMVYTPVCYWHRSCRNCVNLTQEVDCCESGGIQHSTSDVIAFTELFRKYLQLLYLNLKQIWCSLSVYYPRNIVTVNSITSRYRLPWLCWSLVSVFFHVSATPSELHQEIDFVTPFNWIYWLAMAGYFLVQFSGWYLPCNFSKNRHADHNTLT